MSITNYFGKPRAKYTPYKSPYTFEDLPNAYGRETRIRIREPVGNGGWKLIKDVTTLSLDALGDVGDWPTYFPYINTRADNLEISYSGSNTRAGYYIEH